MSDTTMFARRGSARVAGAPAVALIALLLAAVGCSSTETAPGVKAPPGGAAASKAAYAEGDAYGKALRKGLDRGSSDKAMGDLSAARRALEQFAMDTSEYPQADSCDALTSALSTSRPAGIPQTDPWGAPYECRSNAQGYVLRSLGPDGAAGTDDDIRVDGGTPPPL